ncbi:MAG: superoxide dismutase [Bacteroidota bacterium]|nr:superoxide dismutase [Bacteroidota bacterium]
MKFPALPYAYAALEPCIDAKTVEIHYDRHYRNYYNNFIAALAKDGIKETDVPKILAKISSYSTAIRNNGGGFYNHLLYFENMSSGNVTMPDSLKYLFTRDFGSPAQFREQFVSAAKGIFGSGWAWLCVDKNGKLFVTTTPNQDNPLMDIVKDQGTPLLALDVWEHAYYLQYQNKRADYIQSFMSIINWNIVLQRYLKR